LGTNLSNYVYSNRTITTMKHNTIK